MIHPPNDLFGMTIYNPQIADVLNRLEALSGCPGVEAEDISNLVKGLWDLNVSLRQIDVLISPSLAGLNLPADSPISVIEKDWNILQNMTISVVNELDSRRRCPTASARPSEIWSKVCLIKALFYTEKLQILAKSLFKRPGARDEKDASYIEAEDKYHKALDNVEQGLVKYYRKPFAETPKLSFTEKLHTVCEEEGITYEVERAELLDCQGKLRDCKAALKAAHDEIDRPKLENLMRQEAAADFQGAEAMCRELIRVEEDRAKTKLDITDESTILNYRHKLAELLMSQKKYDKAEDIAKDVWEKRLHLREATEPTLSTFILYCRALRRQSSFKEAEKRHREVWELPKGECDESWRVQNGFELAVVLAEWNRCDEAMEVHKAAVLAMKDISKVNDDDLSEMLNSTHELGETLYEKGKFEDSVSVLEGVWETRKSSFSQRRKESIATGELLVKSLSRISRWAHAVTVNRWICETRLEDCAENDPEYLDSLQSLGEALLENKDFSAAAIEFRQTWLLRGRKMGQDHDKTLESCHSYCQALAGAEDYTAIEIVINDVWERRKSVSTKLDLDSGQIYGIVLLKLGNYPKAEQILAQVWNKRIDMFGKEDITTLESSNEYASALFAQRDKNKCLKAEHILNQGWRVKDALQGQSGHAYNAVLEIGCSLALCLRKLKKYENAQIVIDDVCARKKAQLGIGELEYNHDFSIALRKIQKSQTDLASSLSKPWSTKSNATSKIPKKKQRTRRGSTFGMEYDLIE